MLHLVVVVLCFFILFVDTVKGQTTRCNGASELIQLHFDDLYAPTAKFDPLPIPYKGFNIIKSRIPPALLMNTTYANLWFYTAAATTPPNLIFTSAETLFVKWSDESQNKRAFTVLNFTLASIFIGNMGVVVQTLRNDNVISSQTIFLPITVPQTIIVGQSNVDTLVIGCLDPSIDTCAHMAFDTFMMCH